MSNPINNGKVIDIDAQKIGKKIKKIVPGVIIVVVLIFLLSNSIYFIDNSENGVVLRFGRATHIIRDAGIHFKVPVVDEIKKVNVKNIYNMEYGFKTITPGTETTSPVYKDTPEESTVIVDGANNNASIALIEVVIKYRVSNPEAYLFNVDDVEGTLRLALEDVIRTSVQSLTLDQAKTDKKLIDDKIKPALQKKMREYGAGIEIVLAGTQNVKFLPDVETAYQQKENANQYKNSKQEDAERYYNTAIPQGQAEATQLIENATAYKAQTVANANAAVSEFNALYEQYKNNPEILKEKYYIEAMTDLLNNNHVIIDSTQGNDMYKFFNLNESDLLKEQITSSQGVN